MTFTMLLQVFQMILAGAQAAQATGLIKGNDSNHVNQALSVIGAMAAAHNTANGVVTPAPAVDPLQNKG